MLITGSDLDESRLGVFNFSSRKVCRCWNIWSDIRGALKSSHSSFVPSQAPAMVSLLCSEGFLDGVVWTNIDGIRK